MGQTIRQVVIQVAIEQKTATLTVPNFQPVVTAAAKAGSNSATSFETSMDAGIKAVERELKALENQFDADDKAAARLATTTATLSQRMDANKSATIAAYGAGATAAVQMAKGIGFIVASNEKEAESFAKAVAQAQGYFDVLIGGIHTVKVLTDIRRLSAVALAAEAAAAGTATVATEGLAVAGASATVALLPLMPLAIALGVAAAGAAVAWKAMSVTITEAEKAADRSIASFQTEVLTVQRLTEVYLALSQARSASTDAATRADTAARGSGAKELVEKRLAQNMQQRLRTDRHSTGVFSSDDEGNVSAVLGQRAELQKSLLDINKENQTNNERLVSQENEKAAAAKRTLDLAAENLAVQKEQYKNSLLEFGLMSRSDQAKFKRINEKVKADAANNKFGGESLTVGEAQWVARQDNEAGKAARKRLQADALAHGGEDFGNKGNVKQAQIELDVAKSDEDSVRKSSQKIVDKLEEEREQLVKTFEAITQALSATNDQLKRFEQQAEQTKKDIKNRTWAQWGLGINRMADDTDARLTELEGQVRTLASANKSQLALIVSLSNFVRESVRLAVASKVEVDGLIDELNRCQIVPHDSDPDPSRRGQL